MTRTKHIDNTAARVGQALHYARHNLSMNIAETAQLLRISPDLLNRCEQGCVEIPQIMLGYICMNAYIALRMRRTEYKYRQITHYLNKYNKDSATFMKYSTKIIKDTP